MVQLYNESLKKYRAECSAISLDTATREHVALLACEAAQRVGASPFIQLMAGDAAYMAKSLEEIEVVVLKAGGTRAQGQAAARAIGSEGEVLIKFNRLQTRLYGGDEWSLWHRMPTWWPQDGTYLHLEQANAARGGPAYYYPKRLAKFRLWPFF